VCSSCGLCSGPPCIIWDHNPNGDPCPECNPDSVSYDYSGGGSGRVSGGGFCAVLLFVGVAFVVLVAALVSDVMLI
jgi:hypothetical protein